MRIGRILLESFTTRIADKKQSSIVLIFNRGSFLNFRNNFKNNKVDFIGLKDNPNRILTIIKEFNFSIDMIILASKNLGAFTSYRKIQFGKLTVNKLSPMQTMPS